MPSRFILRWSKKLQAPVRGLSLARERGQLLTWDRHGWVYLHDHAGRIQGQTRIPGEVHLAAVSEDGERIVVVDREKRLQRFAPDLAPRFEHVLPFLPAALTLDPFGRSTALADDRGNLVLLDETGLPRWRTRNFRPLRFLAMAPGSPDLLGAGEPGFVVRIDTRGECTWKESLVSNIGGLSVDGQARSVLLACFSAGIQRFDPVTGRSERLATRTACRWVGQSLDGSRIWAGGLGRIVEVLDAAGQSLGELELEGAFRFLAIGPMGADLWAGLEDGRLVQYGYEDGGA